MSISISNYSSVILSCSMAVLEGPQIQYLNELATFTLSGQAMNPYAVLEAQRVSPRLYNIATRWPRSTFWLTQISKHLSAGLETTAHVLWAQRNITAGGITGIALKVLLGLWSAIPHLLVANDSYRTWKLLSNDAPDQRERLLAYKEESGMLSRLGGIIYGAGSIPFHLGSIASTLVHTARVGAPGIMCELYYSPIDAHCTLRPLHERLDNEDALIPAEVVSSINTARIRKSAASRRLAFTTLLRFFNESIANLDALGAQRNALDQAKAQLVEVANGWGIRRLGNFLNRWTNPWYISDEGQLRFLPQAQDPAQLQGE